MEYVTLSNGKKVDWDEFSRWSDSKQVRNINPPNLGKDFGDEFRQKMSAIVIASYRNGTRKKTRNTGSRNGFSRGVVTPLGKFESIKESALAHGVLSSTMRSWILKNKEGYHYLDLDKARVTTLRKPSRSASKAVITPFGKFDSMVDAAKFEGVRAQTLREWVKNSNRSDYEFF